MRSRCEVRKVLSKDNALEDETLRYRRCEVNVYERSEQISDLTGGEG